MGISFILILGLIGVVSLICFSNPMFDVMRKSNNLVVLLKRKKFFHHYWLTGIFSFFMNAILFFLTILALYGIQFFSIPFIHLIVMFLAVGLSIFLWLLIKLSWQGEVRDQLKVGIIGSSFYFFLTVFFIYKYVTIEPLYPGDDTFMRAIGFMFGIIVTSVAFLTCFFLTGFARKEIIR
jgi:hypothetical protein